MNFTDFKANLKNYHQGNTIGIGFQSDASSVWYIPHDGVILNHKDVIHCNDPIRSFQSSDSICCRVALDVYRSGDQHFHHVTFAINGKQIGYPIILHGKLPTSLVNDHVEESFCTHIFDINLRDHHFACASGNKYSFAD